MEITAFFLWTVTIFGAFWMGQKTGIKKGADAMYTHLYNNGVRKNDEVIVKLEYEERYGTKEF